MTVLYIDDEDFNLVLFTMMFKGHFNVITAKSGKEGLEIMEKTPDLNAVITDMNMPHMNGLEFIEKAKSITTDLPYIILTGYSRNMELQMAMEQGKISSCIEKPFNERLIVNTVTQLSNSQH